MPYALVIKHKIGMEKKFKHILGPNEAVRGEWMKLTLKVTNVGNETFPGGKIKELKIHFGQSGLRGILTTPDSPLPECPKLEPNQTKTLLTQRIIPIVEGLGRISVMFETKNKQPIQFYQNPPPAPSIGENSWFNFFYVNNRERILEIMLLQQLLEGKS